MKRSPRQLVFGNAATIKTEASLYRSFRTIPCAIDLLRVAGHLKERMIASLADPESRRIIATVLAKPKTAVEIEKELGLPQSTLYRKISELKDCGLLMVEKFVVRLDGRREALYACPFSEVRIKAEQGEIGLEVIQTEESLETKWFELFFSGQDFS